MRLSNFFFVALCCSMLCNDCLAQPDPGKWQHVLANGKGTLTIYWHESKPFIFRERGLMKGIEAELLNGFVHFLKDNKKVDLKIEWKEAADFAAVYATLKESKNPASLGSSAFSITPERTAEVGFSPPYMADITVMLASKNIPIVERAEDFNKVFSNLTAITIRGTTYEQDILKLRNNNQAPFDIIYIPSSKNILNTIAKMDNGFGFEDLPVYLMMYNKDPSIKVNRQNFFPMKREGYAFIYPRHSDWGVPLTEYFKAAEFKPSLENTMAKYFNLDLYHFVESLAVQTNDPVLLLNKEKEIQDRNLSGVSQQLLDETRVRNFLIAFAVLITIFMVAIFRLYRKSNQQKLEIQLQQQNIELKSRQLEERNVHLVAVNEEKNNLIKILAHDLRTPINHVQGLAQLFLLSNPSIEKEQRSIIQQITEAAIRLTKMITNILDIDAIENSRITLVMEELDLNPVVEQVVNSFEKTALRKNITLRFLGDNQLRIKADSLFLIQILENLISNAIKFSPASRNVEVSLIADGEHVIIKVEDFGPGLSEEDLALVFKKFQRLSTRPTGGESSTGLGLSIVKKYTELMEGEVWCTSTQGKGSSFFVKFKSV